jgi:hypothetical protein
MGIKEVEDGKARTLGTLVQVGKELNIPLPTHEWRQPDGSTVFDDHVLVLQTFQKRVAVEFRYPDLCDCTHDESVRARIKARLKGLLHSREVTRRDDRAGSRKNGKTGRQID